MATSVGVSATNNAEIDGLLGGSKWSGSITYSFPDSPTDYPSSGYSQTNEPAVSGFSSAPTQMQAAINYAIGLIKGYTNISISYAGTNTADIQIAQSPAANPTSYAYYPGNYSAGGDIWFGTAYNYSQAALGNYYFATALHELGHALGLKHSQETGGVANVAVPSAHDDSEYTIMSYRSYVGAPLTGYTAESYGFSQTYMANDILALQTLYGANYNTQSGNTVYTWSATTGQMFINGVGQLAPGGGVGGSANRVFETIWDGNGIDTYDLSNYSNGVSIDLNPGAWTTTSSTQKAYLGNGHYAQGNILNAYLFNGDARSYIDNAIGGAGNDTLIGNAIANRLTGGAGRDTMTGGGGADTFVFTSGSSSAASGQHDLITDFSSADFIDISAIGTFRFLGTSAFDGGAYALDYVYNSSTGITTLQGDINGDRVADFAIDLTGNIALSTASIVGASSTPVVIDSAGVTTLTQIGNQYYLYSASQSGPVLKANGSPVVLGQNGTWMPIGAEQTSNGYLVAWRNPGLDQYIVWNTDSNGNYISFATSGVVSGSNSTLKAIETSMNQDLNGDGTIGAAAPPPPPLVTTVIDSAGSTHLTQVGNQYYLYNTSNVGPVLSNNGSPVLAGQNGTWNPIGAEQTAGGYLIAWKNAGLDQYQVWNADSNGNYLSSATNGAVSGSSSTLKAIETSMSQDLNGDGTIGSPAPAGTIIDSAGSTHLTQVGNQYYLYDANNVGPVLSASGSPVVYGQNGTWMPIGAEQTASGYLVAWKNPGLDQYIVWNTDNNGNYLSFATSGVVPGSNSTLKAIETSMNQDLNGDGTIGTPASPGTVIESFGSTYLTQVGNKYYLYNASNVGPVLSANGSPVVQGQNGTWMPIGAEQTASGYLVAWKNPGLDQYIVWNVDNNGNYLSFTTAGVVPGSNSTLKSIETIMSQDLNGNGTIGSASPLASNSDAFHFNLPERPDLMGQWANAPAAVGDLITAFENAHHALADQIHTILDAIGFAPAADAHGNAGPAHGEWLDHFLLR